LISNSLLWAPAILFMKCSLKFKTESIQNPSHQVVPVLYIISFLLSRLIFIFGYLLSFFLVNRIASIFTASNSTTFHCAHSRAISLYSSSISMISLILLPNTIRDMLSINDKPIAPIFYSTSSNTLEMYITKRVGDTGKYCGILVLVSFMPISWLLMTREAFYSIMKLFVYLNSSRSASSS
jgi:hypothetical protein